MSEALHMNPDEGAGCFIPGFGELKPIGLVRRSFPVVVTVVEDYRVRHPDYPETWVQPGDYVPLKDGTRGVITAVRFHEGRYYICAAPESMVDRAKYLKGNS